MFAAGIVIVWAGYAVGSWGMVLLAGWDISFRQWVNPLHPYRFPPGAIPAIPDTQILPGPSKGASVPGTAPNTSNTGGEGSAGPALPGPASNPSGTVAGGHGR